DIDLADVGGGEPADHPVDLGDAAGPVLDLLEVLVDRDVPHVPRVVAEAGGAWAAVALRRPGREVSPGLDEPPFARCGAPVEDGLQVRAEPGGDPQGVLERAHRGQFAVRTRHRVPSEDCSAVCSWVWRSLPLLLGAFERT